MPFNEIEDVISDIAFIFQWPRSELWATPLPELLDDWRRAVERYRAAHAAKS
ncbi:GpE family phage tail protein [Enterobacter ludwigii]|uniref:GpE family phage tail protein n=1 Tax=Enterobacter ludwigii TaxID=299767 RepID=UPI003F72BD41